MHCQVGQGCQMDGSLECIRIIFCVNSASTAFNCSLAITCKCTQVSPDGQLLAYAVDTRGDECCNLHVVQLPSGAQLLEPPLAGCAGGLVWAPDGRSLFCTMRVRGPGWLPASCALQAPVGAALHLQQLDLGTLEMPAPEMHEQAGGHFELLVLTAPSACRLSKDMCCTSIITPPTCKPR